MDMENKAYFSKQKGFEFMKTIKYYLEYSEIRYLQSSIVTTLCFASEMKSPAFTKTGLFSDKSRKIFKYTLG